MSKRRKDDENAGTGGSVAELVPTSDYVNPGRDNGFKPGRTYTSGTLYEKEGGRYQTPGMSGSLDSAALRGHGKKAVPDTGSWNKVRAKKGEKVRGAERGVGQESIDGLIESIVLEQFAKSVIADRINKLKNSMR